MPSLAGTNFSSYESLSDFDDSLPTRYRTAFVKRERITHAGVCARRRRGSVSLGIVPSNKSKQTAICVSADEMPGFLALMSAAFATLEYEITEALAYRRTMPPGRSDEILDIFWVRDPSKILGDSDIAALSNLVSEYLAGLTPSRERRYEVHPSGPSGTHVRFFEDESGTLSSLDVETNDRFGLLWDVSRALSGCGLQIISSDIKTQGPRVIDKFTIAELTGAKIDPSRRLEIQNAVLAAISGE